VAAIDQPLVWLRGEVKTPPFSQAAREPGVLLRQFASGAKLGLPHSRPMPGTGAGCHELHSVDEGATWRIVYRLDADAVVVVDVFSKKTRQTPGQVIVDCRRRLRQYDELTR
jgi:phage-related protein